MKILLDENLPKKLKYDFGEENEVLTVNDLGWNGKKNGELLGLMVFNGFDALVTIDKKLTFQQNISRFPIKIFVFDAKTNKHHDLQVYMEKLNKILKKEINQQIINISIE